MQNSILAVYLIVKNEQDVVCGSCIIFAVWLSATTVQCKAVKAAFGSVERNRPWLGWFRMWFELDLICRLPNFTIRHSRMCLRRTLCVALAYEKINLSKGC